MNIAFTGHRPNNKHMGGYNLESHRNKLIQECIEWRVANEIICEHHLEERFNFFVGGALGVDQLAFRAVEKVRKYHNDKNIHLILCMPFLEQDKVWTEEGKIELKREQNEADYVLLVDTLEEYQIPCIQEGIYHPAKMQKRNELMVDKCDLIIGVWDGSDHGGTYNCLQYAKKECKKIIIIDPKDIK